MAKTGTAFATGVCAIAALLAVEPAMAEVMYYSTAEQLYRAGIVTEIEETAPIQIDLAAGDSYADLAVTNGWRTCGATLCASLMRGEYSDTDILSSLSSPASADAGLPIGLFAADGANATGNLDAVDMTTSFNAASAGR